MATTAALKDKLTEIDEAQSGAGVDPAAPRWTAVDDLLVDPAYRGMLDAALGGAMPLPRFTAMVKALLRAHPPLEMCDAGTVIGAALQAAQLGLDVGPLEEAYIIPRRKNRGGWVWEAEFQLGYKGMIALAHRAGVIVEAWPVHEKDEFAFSRGTGANRYLLHKPALKDRGDVITYYALAEWFVGDHQQAVFHVMDVDEIEEIRQTFSDDPDGAWWWSFDAMACKTVIRALERFIPKAPDLRRALAADATTVADVAPDLADRAWADREASRTTPAAADTESSGDAAPADPA